MKKTQKTFKKKYVVYGLMAFAGVALVSTGFATWVLAQDVSKTGSGNVTVGAVQEGELGLTLNNTETLGDYCFEPKEDDKSGKVRNDGQNYENLSITFTGTVTNCKYLDSLTVRMAVSDGVWKAAGYKLGASGESGAIAAPKSGAESTIQYWVTDTDAKKYITLPNCVTGEQTVTERDTNGSGEGIDKAASASDEDINADRAFSWTVSFGWGSEFYKKNPGEYYDSNMEGDGGNKTHEEISNTLSAFHSLVETDSKYEVTFTAHNN